MICWQGCTNRLVYVKQLSIPLSIEKEVRLPPPNKILQVMLQPIYTPTLLKAMLNFQAKIMIFVDPLDKNILLYLSVVQFEAKSCVIRIKNTDCSMLCLSPGQSITYSRLQIKSLLTTLVHNQ